MTLRALGRSCEFEAGQEVVHLSRSALPVVPGVAEEQVSALVVGLSNPYDLLVDGVERLILTRRVRHGCAPRSAGAARTTATTAPRGSAGGSSRGVGWRPVPQPSRAQAPAAEHNRATASDLLTQRSPITAPANALEPTPALTPPLLTAREKEVAQRAALGEATADIASALHVSPHTVKTQLSSVYRKLGVTTRSELFTALHQFLELA